MSFRRERFITKGGPDGGDGGDGGSVYLTANNNLNTLADFRVKRVFKADNGRPGMGKERRGKSAEDLIIDVPLGTVITDSQTDEVIGEITHLTQKILVAKGGFHGLGNTRFKSAVNRSPRQTTAGSAGEMRQLNLDLTLLADIGLLGLPNAGKSSLIRQISAAKPKVADYPFTTLTPNLAVVSVEYDSFVVADIPGIVKGASGGTGLGLHFLKHLMRTQYLVHLVDILPQDHSNVVDNYHTIEQELAEYSQTLYQKKRFLVFNKLDLIAADERQDLCQSLTEKMHYSGQYFQISATSGLGCKELVYALNKAIQQTPSS